MFGFSKCRQMFFKIIKCGKYKNVKCLSDGSKYIMLGHHKLTQPARPVKVTGDWWLFKRTKWKSRILVAIQIAQQTRFDQLYERAWIIIISEPWCTSSHINTWHVTINLSWTPDMWSTRKSHYMMRSLNAVAMFFCNDVSSKPVRFWTFVGNAVTLVAQKCNVS